MRNFFTAHELRGSVRKLILALGATAALWGGAFLGQAQAQTPTFSAFPMPGTLTAAPGTDISFRGGTPAQLGTVTVAGSESGKPTGTLVAHSDGQGASFVPEKEFAPGEKVTVTTDVNVVNTTNG